MQKKIYVDGMFDPAVASKVDAAVKAVAGVTSCTANPDTSKVLVDFDESVGGVEDAINAEIESTGISVLG